MNNTVSHIAHVRQYPTRKPQPKRALLLCGFGGNIWQVSRLIATLNKLSYSVTAMDFSKEVLSKGDIALLPALVDEVVAFANKQADESSEPILLVGISLGALLSLNVLRRSDRFDTGVMITGGDIVKVAKRLYGPNIWPQTYDDLARQWKNINMYTNPKLLKDKHLLFVLPKRDRLIDIEDVRQEVATQQAHGNDLHLIERRAFGHVGTIIEEAIVLPHRTAGYIKKVRGQT
jgi:pimeloyl-ACP methyl ester carboxylesterase